MPRRNEKKKESVKDRKKPIGRKKACRFCVDKDMLIDYKLAKHLTQFLTERGKLVPRRMTGNCAFHQRRIVESVKRARLLALLPFSVVHALS